MEANKGARLLLFGTMGVLAHGVLAGLLAGGHTVVGVVIAGERFARLAPPPPIASELPMLPSFVEQSIAALAWERALPTWSVGRIGAEALALLESLAPDAVVVACWPHRLPGAVLGLPRWGWLNVHPSLLPHYRGPAPLFWQLRAGARHGGVTIHRMSERLDEGPILAQRAFPFPAGATGPALDALAARHAARALLDVLAALEAGGHPLGHPQPTGGSYQGWPTEAEFVVPRRWSARRAWNFMRGTAEWGVPFTIPLPAGSLRVQEVLDVAPQARLGTSYSRGEGYGLVQFSPGVVVVRASETSHSAAEGDWR